MSTSVGSSARILTSTSVSETPAHAPLPAVVAFVRYRPGTEEAAGAASLGLPAASAGPEAPPPEPAAPSPVAPAEPVVKLLGGAPAAHPAPVIRTATK